MNLAIDILSSHKSETLAKGANMRLSLKLAFKVDVKHAYFSIGRFHVAAWHTYIEVIDFAAPTIDGAKCRVSIARLASQ